MTTSPINLLLNLDAISDNRISIPQVRKQIPGDVHIYNLQDQGVMAIPVRNNALPWRRWRKAVDAMLDAARRDAEAQPARDRHYWVCGRAPLPIYAYLGMRISKWASRITVINRRGENWDRLVIREGDGEPYFQATKRTEEWLPEGKVAVFISSEHPMDRNTITSYMNTTDEQLAGIVQLCTDGRRWLTSDNVEAATAQINAELQGLRQHYPQHTGLVVFVAGPVQLGLIAGRAVNPRIHRSASFPNFAGPGYIPAIEFPPPKVKPRLLILAADPSDQETIHPDVEIRSIKDMLRMNLFGAPIEAHTENRVTAEHLMYAMDLYDPHILHISAHGSTAGDIGLINDAGKLQTAPMQAITQALNSSERSLKLIILNACFSKKLAKELSKHFDYVIGTDVPIFTKTAIAFAKGLYGALGAGKNLADALEAGRSLAALKDLKGANNFHGFPRPGFDPTSWIPFPRAQQAGE
ncbi:MAG TPA: hypothetical protein ENJ18_04110 [Nannocystis exedens]|nr:hypothetical protein [Nannocystis exedens]